MDGFSQPAGRRLGAETTRSFPAPDRDECSGGPSPCSHTCLNAPGRFSCACPAGFALAWDDRNCRDVDECAGDARLCREGQRCVNLLGSYRCLPDCGSGFRVAADGASCEGDGDTVCGLSILLETQRLPGIS
ncbi:PREDICTED: fibulin-7-like [Cercocebus atys]|uniref:fibulin-7-like n=1 Tax=Cercocebus atys TaxID=9531 RepID=UPI0005F3DF55|nr:PREDICTED: fibulin-7-like [Cercocebus atys]